MLREINCLIFFDLLLSQNKLFNESWKRISVWKYEQILNWKSTMKRGKCYVSSSNLSRIIYRMRGGGSYIFCMHYQRKKRLEHLREFGCKILCVGKLITLLKSCGISLWSVCALALPFSQISNLPQQSSACAVYAPLVIEIGFVLHQVICKLKSC